ncbi:MAG TPA: M56 family metallopeptidase [Terriglobales bacterium]
MPSAPHYLNTLAEITAAGILNSLLAGIAIALVAWAFTCAFGRHGSSTRFAVWFSALVAIAILPWVGHLAAGDGYSVSRITRSAVTLPASFAYYLFMAWIVGAAFGLIRVGLSLYRLQRLRSTCTPVDISQLSPGTQACVNQIAARRSVALCSSDSVRVPAALGYFRPIVVFPAWALQEIPAAELEAILLHELAHLRRWDDWTNLAQKIVKAVFFFHPAVWFIEGRLSIEREMACDDAVLAANFSPRAYAESLLGLAEKSFLRRGVQLAQAAVSHIQQLKMRIIEILRSDRQGSGRVWKPAVALMAVAGVVSMCSVSRGPQLFAFPINGLQSASTVANAGPQPTDAQLRPVNLNFDEAATQRNGLAHPCSTIRARMTRRVAPKPRVDLAQRSAPRQFVENEIATPPMVVLSAFTPTQKAKAASAVLVVMQGEQFGVDGPVLWRLTIIHLTQAQQRAVTGGVPKQI